MSDDPYAGLVRQLRRTAPLVASHEVRDLLFAAAGALSRRAPSGEVDVARLAEAEARYADLERLADPLLAVVRAAEAAANANEGEVYPAGEFALVPLSAWRALCDALDRLDPAGGLP